MRMWKVVCGAAVLAISLMPTAHADEWTKLTYFTFSGPVDMPGMTLPAGTYRFELADPESSRRVIRVSEKDGSKVHGIFLSIPNTKLEPADDPLIMFKETVAGAPQPVRAWWYPGESTGYEFVYPKDQAMKIARANHISVASTDGVAKADTATSDISRVGEDEVLKDSSRATPSTSTSTSTSTTTAPSATTTAAATTTTAASTTTAQPTTNPEATTADRIAAAQPPASTAAAPAPAPATTTAGVTTTAPPATTTAAAATTTAQPVQPAPAPATAEPATPAPSTAAPVGTSGATTTPRATGTSGRLPRTASPLPMMELFSLLSLTGGLALRARRR